MIKIYFFGKKSRISKREREFIRRISKVTEINLCPLKTPLSSNSLAQKTAETKLLRNIKTEDFVIILDQTGQDTTSEKFAKNLENFLIPAPRQNLVFIIGGATGLRKEIKSRADQILKFGSMVWTHDLVRLMLLEQIYRASEIIKDSKFHK